ncbi:NHL repeat containing protein [Candidatus Magnetomorum sp. HK-1]|nr:NHL repeat containing protein [Candidatus Magnetomorum sp. HK-1]
MKARKYMIAMMGISFFYFSAYADNGIHSIKSPNSFCDQDLDEINSAATTDQLQANQQQLIGYQYKRTITLSDKTRNKIVNMPTDMVVDSNGESFFLDQSYHRIEKYDDSGNLIMQWGHEGFEYGAFHQPSDIAIDSNNLIYIADTGNHRVQVFNSCGQFLTQFGTTGIEKGQFESPRQLFIDKENDIYVFDSKRNDIQVFQQVNYMGKKTKAIIVAGGNPYSNNSTWEFTIQSTELAYHALIHNYIRKNSILYLSAGSVENNPHMSESTMAHLQKGITEWASDADSLILYLVDYDSNGGFRLNENEMLTPTVLDQCLDTVQKTMFEKMLIIYDANYSKEFLSELSTPVNRQRILITRSKDENHDRLTDNDQIFFSFFFWSAILSGNGMLDAVEIASNVLDDFEISQVSQINANGNEIYNETMDIDSIRQLYFGNGFTHADKPLITNIRSDHCLSNQTSAILFASGVWAKNGIKRVWAEIIPPIRTSHMPDIFKTAFSEITLQYAGNHSFGANYPYFFFDGTYDIIYKIEDIDGYISIPKQSRVFAYRPMHQRAIIFVSDCELNSISFMQSANDIYHALLRQGYHKDNIDYLCPDSTAIGHDNFPTNDNLQYIITAMAESQTKDVLLFFIGQGDKDLFYTSSHETLAKKDLNDWINHLQDKILGFITIIDDANHSKAYLQALVPEQDTNRILIASTDDQQAANFLSNNTSFTKVFGTFIHQPLFDAFSKTYHIFNAITQSQQLPQIVYGNQMMKSYTIGHGYHMDLPVDIETISQPITLSGTTSATITACNISAEKPVKKVLTIISPPEDPQMHLQSDFDKMPVIELTTKENIVSYSATYYNYSTLGSYELSVCAFDEMGNVSQVLTTTVVQSIGPDVFEEDDTIEQATAIIVDSKYAQRHTFHDVGDEDWIKFYGISGKNYRIQVSHLESNSMPVAIFSGPDDGLPSIEKLFDETMNGVAYFERRVVTEGIFYVRIMNNDASIFGKDTGYDLRVSRPYAGAGFSYYGTISDQYSRPLQTVRLKIKTNDNTNNLNSTISNKRGRYQLRIPNDPSVVVVSKPCFLTHTFTAHGNQISNYLYNIQLHHVGIAPLINILQLLSGNNNNINSSFMIKDFTDNETVGIEDAVYLFKTCFDKF